MRRVETPAQAAATSGPVIRTRQPQLSHQLMADTLRCPLTINTLWVSIVISVLRFVVSTSIAAESFEPKPRRFPTLLLPSEPCGNMRVLISSPVIVIPAGLLSATDTPRVIKKSSGNRRLFAG
jgi:hypothetical protein